MIVTPYKHPGIREIIDPFNKNWAPFYNLERFYCNAFLHLGLALKVKEQDNSTKGDFYYCFGKLMQLSNGFWKWVLGSSNSCQVLCVLRVLNMWPTLLFCSLGKFKPSTEESLQQYAEESEQTDNGRKKLKKKRRTRRKWRKSLKA